MVIDKNEPKKKVEPQKLQNKLLSSDLSLQYGEEVEYGTNCVSQGSFITKFRVLYKKTT